MLLHSLKRESVVGRVTHAELRRTARPLRRRRRGEEEAEEELEEEEEEEEEVSYPSGPALAGRPRGCGAPPLWMGGLLLFLLLEPEEEPEEGRCVVGVDGGSHQSKSLTLREPQRRRERTHMPGGVGVVGEREGKGQGCGWGWVGWCRVGVHAFRLLRSFNIRIHTPTGVVVQGDAGPRGEDEDADCKI